MVNILVRGLPVGVINRSNAVIVKIIAGGNDHVGIKLIRSYIHPLSNASLGEMAIAAPVADHQKRIVITAFG